MYRYLFILLALIALHYFMKEKVIEQPNGILIMDAPLQENINSFIIKQDIHYSITAVAKYDIKARILKKETYSWDKASEFSSIDLALGWQQMSSNELLNTLKITQSNRFYFWSTNTLNYPRKTIETQSSNNHLIAENSMIKDKFRYLHVGQLIEIKGYLVNIKEAKWSWNTSLTREDTGDGACEIIYVTSIKEINY